MLPFLLPPVVALHQQQAARLHGAAPTPCMLAVAYTGPKYWDIGIFFFFLLTLCRNFWIWCVGEVHVDTLGCTKGAVLAVQLGHQFLFDVISL
jgi:hypothetical protein